MDNQPILPQQENSTHSPKQFEIKPDEVGYTSSSAQEKEIQKLNQEIKKMRKNKSEPRDISISINNSVSDIFKFIRDYSMLNKNKYYLIICHVFFTLVLSSFFLMLLLAYLRPIYIIYDLQSFDPTTRTFSRNIFRNFCDCKDNNKCVSFCYYNSYSECLNQFSDEINDNIQEYLLNKAATNKKYLKYPLTKHENKSIFQYIGSHFCEMHFLIRIYIIIFVIGSLVGFIFFGVMSDLKGKKVTIFILTICLIVILIPFCVLNNFKLKNNYTLLKIIWGFVFFFLGAFYFPFDSIVFLYILELTPQTDNIQSLNGLFYIRYLISFALYQIYNFILQDYSYYFFAFFIYLIIFALIFKFFYPETARFYSERSDYRNKGIAIRYFLKPMDINNPKDKTPCIKRISLIKAKDKKTHNQKIHKNASFDNQEKGISLDFLIKLASNEKKPKIYRACLTQLGINFSFYAILMVTLCEMMNPLTPPSVKDHIKVTSYMMGLYLALQGLSYFLYVILNLQTILFVSLFIFSILCISFDIENFTLEGSRIQYFGNKIDLNISKSSPWKLVTCLWIILYIKSMYEIMIMLQYPTVYRTIIYFFIKGISSVILYFSIIFVFFHEIVILWVGIVSLCLGAIFLLNRIKWKSDMFDEMTDKK